MPDIYRQEEASRWNRRRESQVLLHPMRIRHLPQQMDFAPVAVLPFVRGESRGCRSLAEDIAIGPRQHSQNQKSDERSVFSRDPLGVDGTKPDQECTSKCKADEDPGCSDTRRDPGTTQEIARASWNSGRTRCLHWLATWRIDWTPMADVDFENLVIHVRRSVMMMVQGTPKTEASAKRCASRRRSCRISPQAATDQSIQPRNRLGVCFAHNEGKATALAGHSLATIWATGGQGGGDQETGCISRFPALFRVPNYYQVSSFLPCFPPINPD